MDIVRKIIELRKQKGYTQSLMAEKLGIAPNNYGKIETEKTELSVTRLAQIAEILGVSVTELMSVEPPKIEDIGKVKELEKRVRELDDIIKDKNKIIESIEEKYLNLYNTIDQSVSIEITAAMYAHSLGNVKVKSLADEEKSIVNLEECKQEAEEGRFDFMRSYKDVLLTDDELLRVFKSVIEGESDLIKTRLLIGGFLDKSTYAGHIKKFINIAMKKNLFEWQDRGGDNGFWLWKGYNDEHS